MIVIFLHEILLWRCCFLGRFDREVCFSVYSRPMNARLAHASDRPNTRISVSKGVRERLLGKLRGLKVYLVDGELVRNQIDIDFTSGGTSARYAYCPVREIWIDTCLGSFDRFCTIIHEFVERSRMLEKGESYDTAHDVANRVEGWVRESFETLKFLDIDRILKQTKQEGLW